MKKFFRKMPAGFTFTSYRKCYSLKACGVEVLVKKVLANEKKLRQGGAGRGLEILPCGGAPKFAKIATQKKIDKLN